MTIIRLTLTSTFAFFAVLNCALADPLKDFYIQQALDRYFPLPVDARSLATAGSSDMACFGSICSFLNPAGLGQITEPEASASISTMKYNGNEFLTNNYIEGTEDRGYLLLAMPLGQIEDNIPEYGTISLGYSRYQGQINDSISSTPDGHTRSLAYGYNINTAFALGYSFTFYDDQLNSQLADLHSHARILHLFGAQYAISPDTIIGSVFRLGGGQSDTEDYLKESNGLSKPREYSAAIGISRKFNNFLPSLAFDYAYLKSEGNLADVSPEVFIGSNEKGEKFSLRLGLEYSLTESFILRSGARWYEVPDYAFNRSDLKQLSGELRGIGWSGGIAYFFSKTAHEKPGIHLDYGFDYLSAADGQWEHMLSIAVPFST